jgi:hypothetical protein
MDWPLDTLKHYTIKVKYWKNGIAISEAIGWLGMVGTFTATRLNDNNAAHTVAINYRRTKQVISITDLLGNVHRVLMGHIPIAYLVRTNVNTKDFDASLQSFKETKLISPCYVTMFDHNNLKKCCILTRDADGLVSCRHNNLIQTNIDQHLQGPNILYSIERLELMGRLLENYPTTLKELLKAPVANEETIYACLFRGNELETVIV